MPTSVLFADDAAMQHHLMADGAIAPTLNGHRYRYEAISTTCQLISCTRTFACALADCVACRRRRTNQWRIEGKVRRDLRATMR